MPLDDTNDAVPSTEHPHVETIPRARARSAEPLRTSTTTDRATVGQYPAQSGEPVWQSRTHTRPEPAGAIHALMVELVRRSHRRGCEPQSTPLTVTPSVDEGAAHRTLVQVAIPLNDNNGAPFPKSRLQPIFDEIYETHHGATVRPAFGVCLGTVGVDVDALADFEVWTTSPEVLVGQVGRWREALDQREIVVRVFDRVTFISIVKASDATVASNDNDLVGEAS